MTNTPVKKVKIVKSPTSNKYRSKVNNNILNKNKPLTQENIKKLAEGDNFFKFLKFNK